MTEVTFFFYPSTMTHKCLRERAERPRKFKLHKGTFKCTVSFSRTGSSPYRYNFGTRNQKKSIKITTSNHLAMELSTPSTLATQASQGQTFFEPSLFHELMVTSRRLSGPGNLVSVNRRSTVKSSGENVRPCQDTRGILGGSNAFQVSVCHVMVMVSDIFI